jgi:cytoskeleton protein RodZ
MAAAAALVAQWEVVAGRFGCSLESHRRPVPACPVYPGGWAGQQLGGVYLLSTIGEALRSAREGQGKSIQDAAAATHIRSSYLEALEADRFEDLGGHVYAKGFLRSYAAWLGIDAAPLVDEYRELERAEAKVVERVPAGIGNLGYRQRGPNWLVIGLVAFAVVLVAVVYQFLSPGRDNANDPSLLARAPAATATTAPSPDTTAPADTTTPPGDGVKLVLRYVASSWTLVEADGKVVFRGTPDATDERSFSADRLIRLTLGNAGGVRLTVNGRDLGTAGTSGSVIRKSFKPGDPSARS